VVKGSDQTYTWGTGKTDGKYAFSVYGPDGFLTSFAGAVVPAGQNAGPATLLSVRIDLDATGQPISVDGLAREAAQ
jgi:phospholipase C